MPDLPALPALSALPALAGRRPDVLLELDLTQAPVSRDSDDPITRLRMRGRPQLRPILRALHEAAQEDRVVGLIAKVGGELPWAVMQELRLGVQDFVAHGKPALAWAESFGEGSGSMTAFVLASAFDEIWLQPGGELGMLGVGIEATFVRGALDKLGIEPQIQQRHEFKNAANSIMRTEFTEAHRTALDRLAESLFTDAIDMIAEGRGMPTETRASSSSTPDPARPRRLGRSASSTPWATAIRRTPRCGLAWGPTPSCCSPNGGRHRADHISPRGARDTSPSSR